MGNYFPANDSLYRDWLSNFVTVLGDHLAELGLLEADISGLIVARTSFSSDVDGNQIAQAAAIAATGKKRDSRDLTEAYLRPLVRRINNHPGMSNELRGLLGLPQKGVDHTVANASTVEDFPAIALEAKQGAVIIHFGTNPLNERLNTKPAGVKGCNIYRKRAGESGFSMIAYSTSSPYTDVVIGPAADYEYYVQYRGAKTSDLGQSSAEETIAARGMEAA